MSSYFQKSCAQNKKKGQGWLPAPTYYKKPFVGDPLFPFQEKCLLHWQLQRTELSLQTRPRAVLPIPIPGAPPALKCHFYCFRDSSCPQIPVPLFQGPLLPSQAVLEGKGILLSQVRVSPVHTDACGTRQTKAPNCVFCLASLHLISMLSPVFLNSSLRAFFLFSLCQLLLFDLQKQMRNPGESPRPSGMTELSSAPQTPCHSPIGPSWQGEPVHPLPELPHHVSLCQEQGTPGHCSPIPTWALCPPTWAA